MARCADGRPFPDSFAYMRSGMPLLEHQSGNIMIVNTVSQPDNLAHRELLRRNTENANVSHNRMHAMRPLQLSAVEPTEISLSAVYPITTIVGNIT